MNKHLVFWSIAARNVGRFSGRAIAVGVPLLVVMALSAALTFIKDGLLHDALAVADSVPDVTVSRLLGGRLSTVDTRLRDEIARQPGIQRVAPRIWGPVPIGTTRGTAVYTLMGADSPDPSLTLEDGRHLPSSDRGSILVGRSFADRYGARPGHRLLLSDEQGHSAELTVVGVFGAQAAVYTSDLIVTDLETARAFFGYPRDLATDLAVTLDDPTAADQVATSLQLLQKDLRVVTRASQAETARRAFGKRSGAFQLTWLVLLLAVLLLAWAQASSISMEMRREIGVLKALGWQTLDVIEVKMMEAVIVATAATTTGILAGLAFVRAGAPVLAPVLLGWSSLYPAFPVPLHVDGGSVFLLLATGVVPLCGASIFPAWLLGTIEPDTAIRSA